MKKILLPFLIWVTVVTANESTKFLTLEPESTSVDSVGVPLGAIVWMIPTNNIEGNQVVGQFYRFDKRPFQQLLFTDSEVENFLDKHGKEFICYNSENYFLVKRGQQVILLCVQRVNDNLPFPTREVIKIDKELIPDTTFGAIKIFLPDKSPT